MKRAYPTSASAKRHPSQERKLPHHGVYVRLAPSRTHGVGVVAIQKIRKGSSIFPDDTEKINWVRNLDIGRLPREIRRLYDDFAVIKNGGRTYGCPKSFNRLTPAWFLNEPKPGGKANVGCRADYRFYALRDIQPGE